MLCCIPCRRPRTDDAGLSNPQKNNGNSFSYFQGAEAGADRWEGRFAALSQPAKKSSAERRVTVASSTLSTLAVEQSVSTPQLHHVCRKKMEELAPYAAEFYSKNEEFLTYLSSIANNDRDRLEALLSPDQLQHRLTIFYDLFTTFTFSAIQLSHLWEGGGNPSSV